MRDQNVPWIDDAGRVVFDTQWAIQRPLRHVRNDFIDQIVIDPLSVRDANDLPYGQADVGSTTVNFEDFGVHIKCGLLRFIDHPLLIPEISLGHQLLDLIESYNAQFSQVILDQKFHEMVQAQQDVSDALFKHPSADPDSLIRLTRALLIKINGYEQLCQDQIKVQKEIRQLIKKLKIIRTQQGFISFAYDINVVKCQQDPSLKEQCRNIMLFAQLQHNLLQDQEGDEDNPQDQEVEERISAIYPQYQYKFQVSCLQVTLTGECPATEQRRRLSAQKSSYRATIMVNDQVIQSAPSLKLTKDFTLDLQHSTLSDVRVRLLHPSDVIMCKIHSEMTQQDLPICSIVLHQMDEGYDASESTLNQFKSFMASNDQTESDFQCQLRYQAKWKQSPIIEQQTVDVLRQLKSSSARRQSHVTSEESGDPLVLDDSPLSPLLVKQQRQFEEANAMYTKDLTNGGVLTEEELNHLKKDDIIQEQHFVAMSLSAVFSMMLSVKRPLNPRQAKVKFWQ
ncbi:hypothetical protein MP228_007756 [Amoeboaphelidium protococcarum]|nr:hypothetical protein MP228_007756 [Amoeboaphelidium protococcarum]